MALVPPKTFPSRPGYSGPGLWFILHTSGKEATTEEKKKAFVILVDTIENNHPCADECRPHIQAYRKKNPIENYWNIKDHEGKDIGMFLWTFKFHNEVNARLNKPQLDWITAYNMYSNDIFTPCTSSCHEEEKPRGPRFSKRDR